MTLNWFIVYVSFYAPLNKALLSMDEHEGRMAEITNTGLVRLLIQMLISAVHITYSMLYIF